VDSDLVLTVRRRGDTDAPSLPVTENPGFVWWSR
jgi:hypothetical protein